MPTRIARVARGLDARALRRKPTPDAWSGEEIVAHLRACATVWGGSIERMLAEDHPTIRYVSPRGWIRKTDYLDRDFGESLSAFARDRKRLVAMLRALDRRGWSRGATFTGTTLGRDGTVLSYVQRIGDHELSHVAQLQRTLRGGA